MFKHRLELDVTEPLRVAVLPFYQTDDSGAVVNPDTSIFLLDNIPGVSEELEDSPAVIIQKLVQSELRKTSLDMLTPVKVRTDLVHHGFTEGMTYDYAKILRTTPRALCEKLACDAVMYGRVTTWDRSYYGLQSVSTVGIELKLVRARDGALLFEAQSEDSDSRGLTKGPTGYSSLVIEPLRGLGNEIITDLARQVVERSVAPLIVANRPELLDTPPPGIYASAHDAPTGTLEPGKPLTVVMIASGGQSASFSIGSAVENIPMTELDRGHYIGEFYPLPTDHFEAAPVYVYLTDRFGRSTRQRIGLSPVSLP